MAKEIEDAEVPWSQAVVMVCTKCSRKIVKDERLSDELKSDLKKSLKDTHGKSIRVVTSSCLDVCPEDRMAIAVATNGVNSFHTFTLAPDAGYKPALDKIIEIVGPNTACKIEK